MAQDRFVRWRKKPGPSRDEIGMVLEDYVGGAGTVSWKDDRWFAVLNGMPRMPLRRVKGYEAMAPVMEQHRERWFEVYVTEADVDVITRQADEFTNIVAEGFAALLARFYEGKRDKS